MRQIKQAKRVVVKVGTSTLTHNSGHLNLRRVEKLVKVLSDLKNAGKEIVLVSSGAIGVGMGKMGLAERPDSVQKKQALAAIGQVELIQYYDRLFDEYNHTVAQVLVTKSVVDSALMYENAVNTFEQLLKYGVLPIVNENDTISTEQIEFGDNDTLSAAVAELTGADLLIILSDIDGLYDADPRQNKDAKVIPRVTVIDDSIRALAGGAGSKRGTGGMQTKLAAAQIALRAGTDVVIANGKNPEVLYDILDGKPVGTLFCSDGEGEGK